MSEEAARNKVRILETLPFGHRREHLVAYVPDIKERTSPQVGLYLPFSLCKFCLCPRLRGLENSAESPMRLARLSSKLTRAHRVSADGRSAVGRDCCQPRINSLRQTTYVTVKRLIVNFSQNLFSINRCGCVLFILKSCQFNLVLKIDLLKNVKRIS